MNELVGRSEWIRPKAWKLDWELRRDGKVVATMSSPKMFGTTSSATLGGEVYSMRKGGLRNPGVTIRKVGETGHLATLSFDAIWKGTIVLANGQTYAWERDGTTERWTVFREDREAVFTMERDTKVKYPLGKVEADIADPHLGVLLLLSWFVLSTMGC